MRALKNTKNVVKYKNSLMKGSATKFAKLNSYKTL